MSLPSQSHFVSRRNLLKGCAILAVASALSLGFAATGFAQSLSDLRASGKIGEAFDGFARARDGSVQGTVSDINAKRRSIYNERAKQQGTSPDQVGIIYADKIIAKSPSGTWLLMKDGSWAQK